MASKLTQKEHRIDVGLVNLMNEFACSTQRLFPRRGMSLAYDPTAKLIANAHVVFTDNPQAFASIQDDIEHEIYTAKAVFEAALLSDKAEVFGDLVAHKISEVSKLILDEKQRHEELDSKKAPSKVGALINRFFDLG